MHMTRKKTQHFRIAIIQDFALKAAKEITRGVLRYANGNPEWSIRLLGAHMSNNDFLYPEDWKMDGAICGLGTDFPDITSLIREHKPRGIVYTGVDPHHTLNDFTSALFVGNDKAIGETAASLFLRHKFRHFAYIGSRRNEFWSIDRGRFFESMLKSKGFSCLKYAIPSHCENTGEQSLLAGWLKALPKPCGIFVAFDQRALHVINLCHKLGIKIPEQLQLLGVDDEAWLCEQTRPSLSSIAIDFERAGFEAAKTLNAILHRRHYRKHNLLRVHDVVERMSTVDLHGHGFRASRTAEFIRNNFSSALTVTMIASKIGCSTRILETSFKSTYGRTIKDEIADIRVDAIKQHLANPDRRLCEIPHLVGFKTINHLFKFFRQKTGQTPSQYRKDTLNAHSKSPLVNDPRPARTSRRPRA